MKLKTVLILASVGLLINTATAKPTNPPSTVAHVNLPDYMGTWYEIARLPMYFQRKCGSNVSANYTLQTDGSVQVINKCLDKNQQPMQVIGKATTTPHSSQLKVTFAPQAVRWLPFTQADYWVLALDKDYQHALVGTPNRKYLWILSRTPTLDDKIYQQLTNIATQQGYDISQLQKTPQNPK